MKEEHGAILVILALASCVFYSFFEHDDLLPFDPTRLEKDLRESLFGQHIASDAVLKAVTSFMTARKPNKPLVLYFHGTTGVGKTHAAKIIARNIYEKGENSKYVHTYSSTYHLYSAPLTEWIYKSVSIFPRSMLIFDEMDKMHPQQIDTIKDFLFNNARVNGVSFHNAIFILISNTGGNVITEVALNSWREGICREEISKEQMTSMDSRLIDYYIPFLPLMLKHVRQCVLAEMLHMNMIQDIVLADKVARDMPYFPEREKIFSLKGCKSVREKLMLYK